MVENPEDGKTKQAEWGHKQSTFYFAMKEQQELQKALQRSYWMLRWDFYFFIFYISEYASFLKIRRPNCRTYATQLFRKRNADKRLNTK